MRFQHPLSAHIIRYTCSISCNSCNSISCNSRTVVFECFQLHKNSNKVASERIYYIVCLQI